VIAQRKPLVPSSPTRRRARVTDPGRPNRRRGVSRGTALGAIAGLALGACNPRGSAASSPPPPSAIAAGPAPTPASVLTPAAAPDARPPTYTNPVIPGTTPDPSAVRVGDDYYLVTSSFEYFPGVPLYHSRDLVHWRQLGHVLTRDAQLPLRGVPSSQGIYAPTIRHHDGTYYVVTTNMQGGGSFYVKATAPTGPWSDPIFVREAEFTMDPSLFFDDDGKVYYTRHGGGRDGGIYQAEIDLATGLLRAPARLVWKGTGDIWPEGPHLYKVDGTYYLMISEGGTSYEHQVTVARAKSPWGPFEAAPNNPILTHRFLPAHPLQATGHADLLQTPEGRFWLVLLGIRPSTPRRHHLGRETLLAPVVFGDDGWPVVNGGRPLELAMSTAGLPAWHPWPEASPRDEFDGAELGVSWQHVRNPERARYSLTARPGWLRLTSSSASLDDVASPTLVVERQRYHRVRLATALDVALASGQRAGLVVRGNEKNHHQLLVEGAPAGRREAVASATIAGERRVLGRCPLSPGPVTLVVEGYADRYEFFVEQSGQPFALGSAPTTPFAYEQTQSFTGAYVGLYAHHDAGAAPITADFAWFEQRAR